jgi:hypothetical protein
MPLISVFASVPPDSIVGQVQIPLIEPRPAVPPQSLSGIDYYLIMMGTAILLKIINKH